MTDLTLLQTLLGLGDGWDLKDIQLNKMTKEIDIYIEYVERNCYYSTKEPSCTIYDYSTQRRFRHLDIFEYKTFLNAKIPRAKISNGDVRIIPLKWAGERVSYTYGFELKVIETLQLSKNQTRTATYLDTSFEIVHGIMRRGVKRGLERRKLDGIQALSIDEKSYSNGHNYITILSDPIQKRVLDIIEGRKVEDTEELITWTLSPNQCEEVLIVTMDMWKPYMTAVKEVLPNAEISHDNFHIAKYLNKGVDEVRKSEVKKHEELKNTKYIFLKNRQNWTENQEIKFKEINQINLKTSDAWRLKENFKGIYNQWTSMECMNFFRDWYTNTIESNIAPMIKVADTLLKHLRGIINAALTYTSNSVAENLNSQIQIVKSIGRGFANADGYRNSILFFQGKLNMTPL